MTNIYNFASAYQHPRPREHPLGLEKHQHLGLAHVLELELVVVHGGAWCMVVVVNAVQHYYSVYYYVCVGSSIAYQEAKIVQVIAVQEDDRAGREQVCQAVMHEPRIAAALDFVMAVVVGSTVLSSVASALRWWLLAHLRNAAKCLRCGSMVRSSLSRARELGLFFRCRHHRIALMLTPATAAPRATERRLNITTRVLCVDAATPEAI